MAAPLQRRRLPCTSPSASNLCRTGTTLGPWGTQPACILVQSPPAGAEGSSANVSWRTSIHELGSTDAATSISPAKGRADGPLRAVGDRLAVEDAVAVRAALA